jgi:hypothetical protein
MEYYLFLTVLHGYIQAFLYLVPPWVYVVLVLLIWLQLLECICFVFIFVLVLYTLHCFRVFSNILVLGATGVYLHFCQFILYDPYIFCLIPILFDWLVRLIRIMAVCITFFLFYHCMIRSGFDFINIWNGLISDDGAIVVFILMFKLHVFVFKFWTGNAHTCIHALYEKLISRCFYFNVHKF